MSVPRESHTTTLLADGRVLVIGGHSDGRENMEVYASAEIYSPETRRFEPAGTLEIPRHKHDAVELADGRVLAIGGADRTDNVHYETTEVYDGHTGTFERGPSMANRRYIAGTSVRLPSGDVLVTSGAGRRAARCGSWEFREIPAVSRSLPLRCGRVSPGGDVLVTGGYSDSNENTAGIWRFEGL